jgi:hypothetical protein
LQKNEKNTRILNQAEVSAAKNNRKRIESFWHILFPLLTPSLNHLFDECNGRATTPSRDGTSNWFSNI